MKWLPLIINAAELKSTQTQHKSMIGEKMDSKLLKKKDGILVFDGSYLNIWLLYDFQSQITVEEFLHALLNCVTSVHWGLWAKFMHSISVGLRSRLWLPLCSCYISQFWQNVSSETDGFTLDSIILWFTKEFVVDPMTSRCPGPVVAKQAQITPHSAMAIDSW